MKLAGLSWRDRVYLLNSILFCLVGVALVARFATGPAPGLMAVLGAAFLAFGIYRLALVRRGLRKCRRDGE